MPITYPPLNNAGTFLVADHVIGDGLLTVDDVNAFGSPTTLAPVKVVAITGGQLVIMKITGKSSTTLTIDSFLEGTSDIGLPSGTAVEMALTAGDITELYTAIGDGAMKIGVEVIDATSKSVLFVDASGNLGQDNTNFAWDDANNRLGIGTNAPITNLEIGNSGVLGYNSAVNGIAVGGNSFANIAVSASSDAYFSFTNTSAGTNLKNSRWRSSGGTTSFQVLNDAVSAVTFTPITFNHATGDVTIAPNTNIAVGGSNGLYHFHVGGVPKNTIFAALSPSSLSSGDVVLYGNLPAVTGTMTAIQMTGSASTGIIQSLSNTSATSTANTVFLISTTINGGDPKINFNISSVTNWQMGIDNSDSDKLKISSDSSGTLENSTVMTMTTGGLVGIGTGAPLSILDVRKTTTGGTTNIDFYNTEGTNTTAGQSVRIRLGPWGGFPGSNFHPYVEGLVDTPGIGAGLAFGTYAGDALAGTERMRITYDGKVGIGTTAPGRKLHVKGTGSQYLKLEGSGTSSDVAMELTDGTNSTYDGLLGNSAGAGIWGVYNGGVRLIVGPNGNVGVGNVGVGTVLGAQFQVNVVQASNKGVIVKGFASQTANLVEAQNSAGTVLACVDSAGNVGIGRSSALYGLDVYKASGIGIGDGVSDSTHYASLVRSSAVSPYDTLTILSKGGTGGWQGAINFDVSYNNGTTSTGMTIRSDTVSSRVGVNTTAPGSQLQVNTNAATTKGLIVKGFTGQSANLFEAQDSVGTTLVSIGASGNFSTLYRNTISVQRTVPVSTSTNNAVDIGTFSIFNGAASVQIAVTIPSAGFSTSKYYSFTVLYDQTAGNWTTVIPFTSSGPYDAGTQDADLEARVAGGQLFLRLRRTLGTIAGLALITIDQQGGATSFAPSTTVSTVTAPLTFFPATQFTQMGGLSGLNVMAPTGQFQVVPNQSYTKGIIVKGGFTPIAISNVALTSNVATITTPVPHFLTTGQNITITGLTNTVLNGTYVVASTPTGFTFTFAKTNANITSVADTGVVAGHQTANLEEWQDSTGTVVARVSPAGQLLANSIIMPSGGSITGSGVADMSIGDSNDTLSLGGGAFFVLGTKAYALVPFGAGTSAPTAQLHVVPTTAATKGVIVKAGTTTATINNVALTSNVATITTAAAHGFTVGQTVTNAGLTNTVLNGAYIVASVPTSTTFTFAKTNANITSVADAGTATGDQTANLFEVQSSGGTVRTAIDPIGNLRVGAGTQLTFATGNNLTAQVGSRSILQETVADQTTLAHNAYYDGSAWKYVVTSTASAVRQLNGGIGFYVAASGAAGATITNWDTTCQKMFLDASGRVGINETAPGAQLQVNALSASTKGLIVKAFASPTANLTEWQNSSGTVLGSMSGTGSFAVGATAVAQSAFALTGIADGVTGSTSAIGSYIIPTLKPAAAAVSYTQFISGTVDTTVGNVGAHYALRIDAASKTGSNTVSSAYGLYVVAPTIGTGNVAAWFGGVVGIGGGSTASPSGALHVQATGSSVKGLVVQGVVSQSSNLQEWQDSTGALLASIAPSGKIACVGRSGPIKSNTDAGTVTFDMNLSDKHTLTLGGNRTLAVSNDAVGQQFTVLLKQDGTGSRTVTWWSGIKWPNGVAPTLTPTADKEDIFTFLKMGSGDYRGFVAGQNF